MISKRAKRELLDKLHRGYVWTMIGITGIGFMFVCSNFYGIVQNAKQKEKLMFAELESKNDPEEFPNANRLPSTSFN